MRTINEMAIRQGEIDDMIEQYCNIKGEPAIFDGIVDIETYRKAPIKIMWILKEANSADEDHSWNMREAIKELKTENGIKRGWSKTFDPIVYVTLGINNRKYWKDIKFNRDFPDNVDVLKSIAYINLKKFPGTAKADWTVVLAAFIESENIIKEQIKLADPDIIICGGTFDPIVNAFVKTSTQKMKGVNLTAYQENGRVYIETKHPAAFVNKEKYCDDIIQTALLFLDKFRIQGH